MLRIGICEDNQTLQEKYQKLCIQIFQEMAVEVEIRLFDSGEEIVQFYEDNSKRIDIIFMDILMKQLNGMEASKRIRESDEDVLIIFLTSTDEYIFDSMNIQASSYLLKDHVTRSLMKKVLAKAIETVQKKQLDFIKTKKDKGMIGISHQDICFARIYNGFCSLHHWRGIIFETNDVTLIDTLLSENFFKVHDQYIVNFNYIGKIEKKFIIVSDKSRSKLPLEKQYAKDLKQSFAKYMIEKL